MTEFKESDFTKTVKQALSRAMAALQGVQHKNGWPQREYNDLKALYDKIQNEKLDVRLCSREY